MAQLTLIFNIALCTSSALAIRLLEDDNLMMVHKHIGQGDDVAVKWGSDLMVVRVGTQNRTYECKQDLSKLYCCGSASSFSNRRNGRWESIRTCGKWSGSTWVRDHERRPCPGSGYEGVGADVMHAECVGLAATMWRWKSCWCRPDHCFNAELGRCEPKSEVERRMLPERVDVNFAALE